MQSLRVVAGMFSVGMMVFIADGVYSQDYPNKPIRIVTVAIGSASDLAARLIAQGISGPLGQSVVVENRPTGIITAEVGARAPADGYTLVLYSGSLWVVPLLQKTSYDAAKDFAPISLLISSPRILVVHPSVPAKSAKELIDLAKAKPGVLNYASTGIGGGVHLATELFKAMAGINIMNITSKSSGTAVIGLLGGEVHMMIDAGPSLMPSINSGKLRALAITSPKPSALFPGLPTVADALPGYEADNVNGIFVPAKTPTTIIAWLNQKIVRVLSSPEVKEKFFNAGSETIGSSPEELAAFMKSDIARMSKVIKDAGIRAE